MKLIAATMLALSLVGYAYSQTPQTGAASDRSQASSPQSIKIMRAGERPDLAGKATVPDVLEQAHSASLQMTFYTATNGVAAFPPQFHGDAFVALHGSWNRATRTRYKLVRIPLNNGVPTGRYDDFLTGFVTSDRNVWGRPVGVIVARDGTLLMTEGTATAPFGGLHMRDPSCQQTSSKRVARSIWW